MVAGYVPPGESKRKLIYESRLHIWDEPYLFRVCSNSLLRRCVPAKEGIKIIERCHSSPYGGHYGAFHTHSKIWQSGFFWPTMYEDMKDFIQRCERVRGMRISIQEMSCHSPPTSRSNLSMSGVLTTWDHFQSQRTMNTSWWQLTMSPSGLKPCHVELLMLRTPRRCLKRQYFHDLEFLGW